MTFAGAKKAVLPFVASIVGLVIAWVATGDFDVLELRILGAGTITALAIYAVPNVASTPFLKALVPSALAIVAVGTSALESGEFTSGDLQTAVAGLLTSALVWWVKNEGVIPAANAGVPGTLDGLGR